MKKGKKQFSKKSYWVSAKTYGKRAKLVNTEVYVMEITDAADEKLVVDVEGDTIEIVICNEVTMKTAFFTDDYTKNEKAKPISNQIRWEVSNKSLAKISKNGKLTTFDKEGVCYLYARAHNGKAYRMKIKIKNYARPDSFPYY